MLVDHVNLAQQSLRAPYLQEAIDTKPYHVAGFDIDESLQQQEIT